jgi:hypothetical protein
VFLKQTTYRCLLHFLLNLVLSKLLVSAVPSQISTLFPPPPQYLKYLVSLPAGCFDFIDCVVLDVSLQLTCSDYQSGVRHFL